MAETTKAKKAPAKSRKTTKATDAAVTENGSTVAETTPARTPAKAAQAHSGPISQEEIARLAHQYWTERGHGHGKHEDDWFRAEQELRKRAS